MYAITTNGPSATITRDGIIVWTRAKVSDVFAVMLASAIHRGTIEPMIASYPGDAKVVA